MNKQEKKHLADSILFLHHSLIANIASMICDTLGDEILKNKYHKVSNKFYKKTQDTLDKFINQKEIDTNEG